MMPPPQQHNLVWTRMPRLPWSLARTGWRYLVLLSVIFSLSIVFFFLRRSSHTLPERKLYIDHSTGTGASSKLNVCPYIGDELSRGPITADTDTLRGMAQLEDVLGPVLTDGGHFKPKMCRSQQMVALIVPYRDRFIHLKKFLWHMHPFLQRQSVEYGIFVIEQDNSADFNRGLLMNIGYKEVTKLGSYDCFIFHDVDLLPLDDRIIYRCSDMPVHLSVSVDTLNFKLMYDNLFGGACALTRPMMEDVNGFSNVYFGWGGEDDDMSYRIRSHGMQISRYKPDVAKYTMLRHAKAEQNDRSRLLASSRSRIHRDGLNSLKYKRLGLELRPLYTWIKVKLTRVDVEVELSMVK